MRAIDDITVTPEQSALDVMRRIDATQAGIALVVDDGVLVGTVTDGDIRRGLLRGLELSSPVSEVMGRRPVTAHQTTPEASILELLRVHRINQVPVVDDEHRPIALFHVADSVGTSQTFAAAVVVDAAGTRDAAATDALLERLATAGITDVHLEEGALASVLDNPPNGPILVVDGTLEPELDLARLLQYHHQHDVAATVVVVEHLVVVPDAVRVNGPWVSGVDDAPVRVLSSVGTYVLQPDIVHAVTLGEVHQLPAIVDALVATARPVIAYPFDQRWVYV